MPTELNCPYLVAQRGPYLHSEVQKKGVELNKGATTAPPQKHHHITTTKTPPHTKTPSILLCTTKYNSSNSSPALFYKKNALEISRKSGITFW